MKVYSYDDWCFLNIVTDFIKNNFNTINDVKGKNNKGDK